MTERHVKVGVLGIQGAFIEHIRMLQQVAEVTADAIKITITDVRKPEHVADLDGLIIPGGESTTLSVFLGKNGFEQALKSWLQNEKKPGVVWGTCAGLILLSDDLLGQKQGGQITLGGLNIQCTRNIYGRQVGSFEAELKLQEPGLSWDGGLKRDEFHGIFIRAPGIAKINSPSVKVLAVIKDSDNTVVAVQQENMMATTFHPELTDDIRWHSYFVDMVTRAKYPELKLLPHSSLSRITTATS